MDTSSREKFSPFCAVPQERPPFLGCDRDAAEDFDVVNHGVLGYGKSHGVEA